MTDQPQHQNESPLNITPEDIMNELIAQRDERRTSAHFTEAPYSGNVRARIAGYDWQLTIRASDSKTFLDKINGLMVWLNNNADRAVNVETPHTPTVTAPAVPPAPPVVAAPTGPMNAQCVMIEVGTSYTTKKPQLQFACNGLEHPLTFTKDVNEMAKLLAPLGFTAAHMVIGQKYPVNCIVTYTESSKDGKTYKNVQSVKAA